jgi:hypothetical protein
MQNRCIYRSIDKQYTILESEIIRTEEIQKELIEIENMNFDSDSSAEGVSGKSSNVKSRRHLKKITNKLNQLKLKGY